MSRNERKSSTKEVIQETLRLGIGHATNSLEARTVRQLLHDVGRTSALGHASAPIICPEDHVKLHELCKACKLFTQRAVALKWLDDSIPHSNWPPRERYRLCTVAHLQRLNGRCHFCTTLYYFVARLKSYGSDGDLDNNWLYFDILQGHKPWEHGYVELVASLYPRHLYVKKLDLCLQEDERNTIYPDTVPLRSNDNTERLRQWIESCLEDHGTCRATNDDSIASATKPDRMLAIDGDRVKLVCNWSESGGFKYLALSHMWGIDATQQLRLVLSRLEEFQEEIPWLELPFIFKEAIRMARQVGYNYIWIDSLCIIQDSVSDWAKEAPKMAHVYGHADCTIAYLLPPQDVFTEPRRDPRIWYPCILRFPSHGKRGMYICPDMDEEIVRSNDGYGDDDIKWLSPNNWPLFKRAWTFQEYLLSPRIVFVGHQNLMWECSESRCDEIIGPLKAFPGSIASKAHLSAVGSITLPENILAAQLKSVGDWEQLIHDYRARALTQPKDRIMAFAGIAQAAHSSNRMTYMAGSWEQMFPFSFTWSVFFRKPSKTETREASAGIVREAVTDAAPSWSWFSVPIFTHHEFAFHVNQDLRIMLSYPEKNKIEPMYQTTLLSSGDRSREVHAKSLTTEAFCSFTRMTLDILIKTCIVFLWHSIEHDLGYRTIAQQFEKLVGKKYGTFQYYLDRPDELHDHSDKVTLGLLLELRTGHDSELSRGYGGRYLVGLLMQPESSCEAYKRIGLWSLKIAPDPAGWEANTFKMVSIFDQLEGVRSEHIRLV